MKYVIKLAILNIKAKNYKQYNSVYIIIVCLNNLTHPLNTYQSRQLIASPYPGVSTTVRRSFTPLSSISTVEASICTVLSIFSRKGTKLDFRRLLTSSLYGRIRN